MSIYDPNKVENVEESLIANEYYGDGETPSIPFPFGSVAVPRLKPCPFCNGQPFGPYQYGTNWYVACEDCEVQMDSMFKHKVVEKWNRRENDQADIKDHYPTEITFPSVGYLIEKLSQRTGMLEGEIEEILDELKERKE